MWRISLKYCKYIVCFCCIKYSVALQSYESSFKLERGDLLFQDLNCGVLCDGIGSVTYGIGNSYIAHVALVVDTTESNTVLVEASGTGVSNITLHSFLSRQLDRSGNPRVIVGRLDGKYQSLIPKAIEFTQTKLGLPYNESFYPNNGTSYYCSELIYAAFKFANNGIPIFNLNPMDFTSIRTKQIVPAWKEYFKELDIAPPQGLPGSNPGELSRESIVYIVYQYGALREVRL